MSQYKNQGAHLIRAYGTKDEIERLDAGVLPEDEFDMIVGDVLFEAILDLPVRQKMIVPTPYWWKRGCSPILS